MMKENSRRKFIKAVSIAGLLSPLVHVAHASDLAGKQPEKEFKIGIQEKDEYLSAIKEVFKQH